MKQIIQNVSKDIKLKKNKTLSMPQTSEIAETKNKNQGHLVTNTIKLKHLN